MFFSFGETLVTLERIGFQTQITLSTIKFLIILKLYINKSSITQDFYLG